MHIQPQAYSSQKVVESSSKLQVGSPNTHMFESTITKLSLFLSHTSCTSLIMQLLRWFINSTFSGVFKSSLFLISFRFGETFFSSALCKFPLFGVSLAFPSIMKHMVILCLLLFSLSTDILLRSTVFSKSLSSKLTQSFLKKNGKAEWLSTQTRNRQFPLHLKTSC